LLHHVLYVPQLEQILLSSKQLKKEEGYLHNDSFNDNEHYLINHKTNHRIQLVDSINDTYKIIAQKKHEQEITELNAITRSQSKKRTEESKIFNEEEVKYETHIHSEVLGKKGNSISPSENLDDAHCRPGRGLVEIKTTSDHESEEEPDDVGRPTVEVNINAADKSINVIHHKYGHISNKAIRALKQSILAGKSEENKAIIPELDKLLKYDKVTCTPCDMAKITQSSFLGEYMKNINKPNDQADADLIVMYIKVTDKDGKVETIKRYVSLITDVYSRHVHMRILDKKSEASLHVLDYYHLSKKVTGNELKCFHSDNGKEYKKAIKILEERHVTCTNSPPYTSQRNPIAERKNRTLEEMMRALLIHANLDPFKYWKYAMKHAVYEHNRLNLVEGTNKTQHELFTGEEPNLKHLHSFGCDTVSLISTKEARREKFLPKGEKGTFIGFNSKDHSYDILLADGSIKSTVHVRFHEDQFTFNRSEVNGDNKPEIDISLNNRIISDTPSSDPNDSGEDEGDQDDDNDPVEERTLSKIQDKIQQLEKDKQEAKEHNLRRSERKRQWTKQTGYNLDDFGVVNYHVTTNQEITSSTPKETIYTRDVAVPNTRRQAMNSPYWPYWRVAEEEELESFEEMKVYQEVDKPTQENTNIVGCRWVYAVKKEHGKVTKFKARLVAQGFSQVHGVDYDETFSGTVKAKSIRVIMALTAMKKYILETADFSTAFLNAPLEEVIYMSPPPGFESSGKVWKLLKAVYGLKQAGRAWRITVDKFIVNELGFKRLISDQCIYIKMSKNGNLMILSTYVDDIPSSYHPDDKEEWNEIKQQMAASFKIKFLGEAETLLNMRITRDKNNNKIYIDQSSYVDMILEEFDRSHYAPVSSPSSAIKLTKNDCPTTEQGKLAMKQYPYRRLVGLLMYLSNATRPDIAHAIRNAAQFMDNPGYNHWKALITIVKYLKGTKNYGLVFNGNMNHDSDSNQFPIVGYADADWGGNEDRKSTTGGIITLGGNVVDWLCNKQQTPALSSCEAEYIATGAVVQSMLWLDSLLQEMGLRTVVDEMPLKVHNDNQSAIAISKNDVLHHRIRHIDIRHHFIRDLIEKKKLVIDWIPTAEQIADILTKSLKGQVFNKFKEQIVQAIKEGEYHGISGTKKV